MRTFRTRTATATATALLAALSLTACQSGDGDAAAVPSGTASAPATASPDANAPAPAVSASPAGARDKGQAQGTGQGGNADKPADSSRNGGPGHEAAGGSDAPGAATTSPVTCTGENTEVAVSKLPRPINHMMLTATNTGSRPCFAYASPLLRFDDDQAATAVRESTRPQAVVTLAPGETAYAAIILNAERTPDEANGRTVERLTVLFSSRDGSGSVGAPTTLTLPADTYKDDDATVTYWQSSMDEALS